MRELDSMTLMMLEDNEFIVKTEFEHEERVIDKHKDGDLVYVLRTKKVIPGKPKKPHPKKEDYAKKQFLKTWLSDGYIDELTDDHCLIFNKFAECDRHLLVITKRQENQTNPLNVSDFKAALLVQKALNAFLFFNCGFESGGSMNHKHIQLMPYSILGGSDLTPLEQIAINYCRTSGTEDRMFTIPQFSYFKHVFLKLDRDFYNFDFESVLDMKAEVLVKHYHACHEFLGNAELRKYQAYNLVLTKNFLFVALRTTDSFHAEGKTIAIGGKAFVGVPIANNEVQRQLFKSKGLIRILNQICVPAVNTKEETLNVARPKLRRTFTLDKV